MCKVQRKTKIVEPCFFIIFPFTKISISELSLHKKIYLRKLTQGLRRSYKIQFGNRENCLHKRNHVIVYKNYLPGQGCIRKWCDTNNIEMTEISICNCIFPTTWWGHRCHKLDVFNLSKLKVTAIIPTIPFQIILSIICTVLKKINLLNSTTADTNQPWWSIHCLNNSIGGCAPYFSNAGILKSSTNITDFFPFCGPNTPCFLFTSFPSIISWVWLALVWAEKLKNTDWYLCKYQNNSAIYPKESDDLS